MRDWWTWLAYAMIAVVSCSGGAAKVIDGGDASPPTDAPAVTSYDAGCSQDAACPDAGDLCPDETTACADACVNLINDTRNCGGCGIICDGTCALGRCLVVIAQDLDKPYGVAVNQTSVYVTANDGLPGEVWKMGLDGNAPMLLNPLGGLNWPHHLVLDETSIYWTTFYDGTVRRMSLDGGDQITLASGLAMPHGITIDGDSVYWTTWTATGEIRKAPRAGGGTPATGTMLAGGQKFPMQVAVDATYVYWTTLGDPGGTNGTVMKAPLGGGDPTTLAAGQLQPDGIAVDATSIYWVTTAESVPGGGLVMKMPLGGGPPVTLASGNDRPYSIAINGTHLYWADYGRNGVDGAIKKVPLTGGDVTVVAFGPFDPYNLAIDATSVYWTNFVAGTVVRATPK